MPKASEILTKDEKSGPRASDELTGTGSAALTKKLRIEYDDYVVNAQENGAEHMPFHEWVAPEYALDRRGLAYKLK